MKKCAAKTWSGKACLGRGVSSVIAYVGPTTDMCLTHEREFKRKGFLQIRVTELRMVRGKYRFVMQKPARRTT